jgi:hypothetical protein
MLHSALGRPSLSSTLSSSLSVRAVPERYAGLSSRRNGPLSSTSLRRRSVACPAALPARVRVFRRQWRVWREIAFSKGRYELLSERDAGLSARPSVAELDFWSSSLSVRAGSARCVRFGSRHNESLSSATRRRSVAVERLSQPNESLIYRLLVVVAAQSLTEHAYPSSLPSLSPTVAPSASPSTSPSTGVSCTSRAE